MIWPFQRAGRTREISGGARYSVSPDVKASPHANGVVFLHRTKGTVFAANRIGARIWHGSGEGKSVERIAAEISREFGVPEELAQRDARDFLRELENAGILVRNHADAAA